MKERFASLQTVLHYQLCPSLCAVQPGRPSLLCILTAICKLLAGGNDFTEKVTPLPLVHINQSFIHFHVYKRRGNQFTRQPARKTDISKITCRQQLPIREARVPGPSSHYYVLSPSRAHLNHSHHGGGGTTKTNCVTHS